MSQRFATSETTGWTCGQRQRGGGLVYPVLEHEPSLVLKVLELRDVREAQLLARAAGAGLAPAIVESGHLTSGDFVGRPYIVMRDCGEDLRSTLQSITGLRSPDVDSGVWAVDLGRDLLNLLLRARAEGLEVLQLRPEHVLLNGTSRDGALPSTGRVVLCGWSGAWALDDAVPANGDDRVEQPPVIERTTVKLWALLMNDVLRAVDPGRAIFPNRLRDLLADAESKDPNARPSLDECSRRWTGEEPVALDERVSWQAKMGARAIDHPLYRYGLMAAGGIAGIVLGLLASSGWG